jgi:hypothetical protein
MALLEVMSEGGVFTGERCTAVALAVRQPVCQELILLGLFVLLIHAGVGIFVTGVYRAVALKPPDLQHPSVVIGPYLDTQTAEHGALQLVLVLVKAENSGVAAALNNLETHFCASQYEFAAITGLIVRKKAQETRIVRLANRMQV